MVKRMLVVLAIMMAVATQAEAQSFAAELRGSLAIPTGDWNDEDELNGGWGVGANLQAMFSSMLGAYVGYDYFSFPHEEDPDAPDAEVTTTDMGFRGGVQIAPVLGAIRPFVRGGVFIASTETDASDGGSSITFEYDSDPGFEVEGGIDIPLGPTLSFTPAVLYRQHGASFEFLGETTETTVAYYGVGLGLKYNIGIR